MDLVSPVLTPSVDQECSKTFAKAFIGQLWHWFAVSVECFLVFMLLAVCSDIEMDRVSNETRCTRLWSLSASATAISGHFLQHRMNRTSLCMFVQASSNADSMVGRRQLP